MPAEILRSIAPILGVTAVKWMLQKSRGEDMFVIFTPEVFQSGF